MPAHGAVEQRSGALPSAARAWGVFALAIGLAFVPFVLLYRDNYWINILTYTYLMGGLATAWNIIGGFGGQFSAAHGVFFGIGAYMTARLYGLADVSPWLAMPVCAAVAALVATLISWPTFRLRGPFFAIATMAFNEVALALANYAEPLTGGARGLSIPFRAGLANMIFADRWKYALLMFAFLALGVALSLFIRRSRLGYYLLAIREDEDAAQAAGVNVLQTKLVGMAVSAALTGVGGTLFTMYIRFIDPPTLFSLSDVGIKFALIALIGGMGTVLGPMLGAALVIPVESYLRVMFGGVPGVHLAILGMMLMLAALFLKRGIVGALVLLKARMRRGAR
jgi:branched-chain amino acid transport system permease protein